MIKQTSLIRFFKSIRSIITRIALTCDQTACSEVFWVKNIASFLKVRASHLSLQVDYLKVPKIRQGS